MGAVRRGARTRIPQGLSTPAFKMLKHAKALSSPGWFHAGFTLDTKRRDSVPFLAAA